MAVDVLRIFRGEGRIEIGLSVEKGDEGEIKGIVVSTNHHPVPEAYKSDPMFPPLLTAKPPLKLIHLDTGREMGDIHRSVRSTFGRIFSGARDGWEKGIGIQDPDPVSRCLY